MVASYGLNSEDHVRGINVPRFTIFLSIKVIQCQI